jgi:hypothetical protein
VSSGLISCTSLLMTLLIFIACPPLFIYLHHITLGPGILFMTLQVDEVSAVLVSRFPIPTPCITLARGCEAPPQFHKGTPLVRWHHPSHVVVLHSGRVLAQGTPAAITGTARELVANMRSPHRCYARALR